MKEKGTKVFCSMLGIGLGILEGVGTTASPVLSGRNKAVYTTRMF